jgi:hypothetical protein
VLNDPWSEFWKANFWPSNDREGTSLNSREDLDADPKTLVKFHVFKRGKDETSTNENVEVEL